MKCRKNVPEEVPQAAPAEETADLEPVSEEKLDGVTGAGNPWEGIRGVPQKPIDEDLRDRA